MCNAFQRHRIFFPPHNQFLCHTGAECVMQGSFVPLGYELQELLQYEVKQRVWTKSRGQSLCKNEINFHVEIQVTAEYILVLQEQEMNYCQRFHCELCNRMTRGACRSKIEMTLLTKQNKYLIQGEEQTIPECFVLDHKLSPEDISSRERTIISARAESAHLIKREIRTVPCSSIYDL